MRFIPGPLIYHNSQVLESRLGQDLASQFAPTKFVPTCIPHYDPPHLFRSSAGCCQKPLLVHTHNFLLHSTGVEGRGGQCKPPCTTEHPPDTTWSSRHELEVVSSYVLKAFWGAERHLQMVKFSFLIYLLLLIVAQYCHIHIMTTLHNHHLHEGAGLA